MLQAVHAIHEQRVSASSRKADDVDPPIAGAFSHRKATETIRSMSGWEKNQDSKSSLAGQYSVEQIVNSSRDAAHPSVVNEEFSISL